MLRGTNAENISDPDLTIRFNFEKKPSTEVYFTNSPATQSFNPLFFFRKLRFMVLCYFKSLERDISVVFLHSNYYRRVPYMGDIHVNSADYDHAGRGA